MTTIKNANFVCSVSMNMFNFFLNSYFSAFDHTKWLKIAKQTFYDPRNPKKIA